jgi:Hypothetical glycosyl hydrolase family 15
MLRRALNPAPPHARSVGRYVPRSAVLRAVGLSVLAIAALVASLAVAAPAGGRGSAHTARKPDTPTRLAWFYMRNTDSTTPATLVARSAVMILSGSDQEVGFLQKVRRAGWRKPILEYFNSAFAMGPTGARPGSCRAGFEGFTTSLTWRRNDFCNIVNRNESWFLHNGAGQRLIERMDDQATLYLMNPASPGWRSFVQAKIRQAPRHFHMDGFFLDNVWETAIGPRSREDNSDGTCRECGSDARWRKGYLGFLKAVKKAAGRRRVWINSDNSRAYVRAVDGGMIENMGASWGQSFMSQSEIESRWRDIDRVVAARKSMLLVGQGDGQGETDRMRFAHAVYLMVAGPRVAFRFQNADNYREFWDYPEFRFRMGAPAGRRHRVGRSIWVRKFKAGIAVVNLSGSRSQTLSLGSTYVLPDGRRSASVTLGPHDGLAATRSG